MKKKRNKNPDFWKDGIKTIRGLTDLFLFTKVPPPGAGQRAPTHWIGQNVHSGFSVQSMALVVLRCLLTSFETILLRLYCDNCPFK